jgi:predicted nucleotide-binding protein
MAEKFRGTVEELKAAVQAAGIHGTWSDDGQGKFAFRSRDGGVLNFWPSRGTLQLQGNDHAKKALEAVLSSNSEKQSFTAKPKSGRKLQHIFIVHGHDTEARDQLELALRRLGLEPFILMNTSGGGKTIIEALEGQIGRDYSSDFGIALLTPDDVGYAKKDGPDRAEPRARQNVVLETGMLLSSLTRDRMAIVVKGHVEIPSDLQGIIRLNYNDHIKEIVPKLCQRLKEVGFNLDPDQIAAAAQ